MCGATSPILHLLLWNVQKQTVHNILRSDPVLYFMTLTGVSKSVLLTKQPATLNFCWEFCFFGTERLDWVEERACSRFETGVK